MITPPVYHVARLWTPAGEVACGCAFSENEWARIERYVACVNRLTDLDYFRTDMGPTRYSITSGPEGVRFDGEALPPPDAIAAVLHRMRPLVLQGEETAFLRIRKLMAWHLEVREFRDYLDFLLDRFTGKLEPFAFLASGRSHTLNSFDGMMDWLNAREYHSDPTKAAFFAEVATVVPDDYLRAMNEEQVLRCAAVATELRELIMAMKLGEVMVPLWARPRR